MRSYAAPDPDQGLLAIDSTPDDSVGEALKRKRQKLAETRIKLEPDDDAYSDGTFDS